MKLTISGLPGAGKGDLIKRLVEKYNLPHFSVGDLRREYAKKLGMSIQEFNKYSETNSRGDLDADEFQKKWASEQKSFILEGRLSHFILKDEKEKPISIFLTGDQLILAKRIFNANRDTEEKCNTIEEQLKINRERCKSDNRRYLKIYGTKNCYNPNDFDIVIDTTTKTPEEVLKIIDAKIIDYNQKMNPPKFYLAHPSESRIWVRKWELEFERRTGIELINPFFDCDTVETDFGNIGKKKYNQLGKNVTNLYKGDLEQIARKDVLGGIVIFDNNWTWGTPAEQGTLWLTSKLIYTVVLNPDKDYSNHPVTKWYSNKTYKTLIGLERYLAKNKSNLFREIEKTRQGNLKNSTYQLLIQEIKRNEEFLGR